MKILGIEIPVLNQYEKLKDIPIAVTKFSTLEDFQLVMDYNYSQAENISKKNGIELQIPIDDSYERLTLGKKGRFDFTVFPYFFGLFEYQSKGRPLYDAAFAIMDDADYKTNATKKAKTDELLKQASKLEAVKETVTADGRFRLAICELILFPIPKIKIISEPIAIKKIRPSIISETYFDFVQHSVSPQITKYTTVDTAKNFNAAICTRRVGDVRGKTDDVTPLSKFPYGVFGGLIFGDVIAQKYVFDIPRDGMSNTLAYHMLQPIIAKTFGERDDLVHAHNDSGNSFLYPITPSDWMIHERYSTQGDAWLRYLVDQYDSEWQTVKHTEATNYEDDGFSTWEINYKICGDDFIAYGYYDGKSSPTIICSEKKLIELMSKCADEFVYGKLQWLTAEEASLRDRTKHYKASKKFFGFIDDKKVCEIYVNTKGKATLRESYNTRVLKSGNFRECQEYAKQSYKHLEKDGTENN